MLKGSHGRTDRPWRMTSWHASASVKRRPVPRSARCGSANSCVTPSPICSRAASCTIRFSKPVLVTVPEVRMSPDLKLATAYVMPLGGEGADEVVEALDRNKRFLRGEIARRVNLKFAPEIRFRVDERFDEAERIEKLLRTPAVQRDLDKDSTTNDKRSRDSRVDAGELAVHSAAHGGEDAPVARPAEERPPGSRTAVRASLRSVARSTMSTAGSRSTSRSA